MAGLTYKDAGVDIDAGDELVRRIAPLAAKTRIPEQLGGVGGFAGLCGLPAGVEDPVLVSGTDGVGTKLKLAFALDVHDTIGIDLVAMCVNDVLTVGARPLFFLDYFATGKLDVDRAEAVIKGIAEGCRQAGCALLGGETAELPGFYQGGEYDLAGFAVGVVDRKAILDGKACAEGDVLFALESSGLHSNGYSLARKALFGDDPLAYDQELPELDRPVGETLLAPTKIYAAAVRAALGAGGVHAIAHITGGGVPGNLPRVLPDGLGAEIDESLIPRPPIFDVIQRRANVETHEMRRTFNLGVGLILAVAPGQAGAVADALAAAGERAHRIGSLVAMPGAEGEARVRYLEAR
jgi:phosphoribosylformylglycinamidine cyclo-ligase